MDRRNPRGSIHPPTGIDTREAAPVAGEEWLDAATAAALLEVKRTTLYSYASRGLVRTTLGEEARERRYRREDLERLRARSRARAGHGAVAAGALRWGEPVLDTSISEVASGRLRYRGHDVLALVEPLALPGARRDVSARFEAVAELLWTGRAPSGAVVFPATDAGLAVARVARLVRAEHRPLDRLAIALPLAAATELEVAGDDATLTLARRLTRRLAAWVALDPQADDRVERALAAPTVAEALALALGARASAPAVHALDRALVLLADHELNASTFTARVAASTGASLHACVGAALAALSGPQHGGRCDRIEALLAEARGPEDAARILRARLVRGDEVPGFGHPLYPDGDPRTPPLLALAEAVGPKRPALRTLRAFVDAMALARGEPPAVDVGLVALAAALDLPPGSAAAIMAVGRSAGWIAHVLEQRRTGALLRPRARYVPSGPLT